MCVCAMDLATKFIRTFKLSKKVKGTMRCGHLGVLEHVVVIMPGV